ncbi:hypothetical protein L8O47_08495 [Enterobacter roggenkampii]|uniref:hypothetical protein n=1 Tax=Enterobacter roggenkampii TaxID=1812935 RepID=UPI0020059674|nr:hypothetical protein [Enterobacter roggenkampii]MCK7150940.1 hypothetical protein [Enterobacter roggenkampii]
MSESLDNNKKNHPSSRRVKLEDAKIFLPESIYSTLLSLLEIKAYNEFDNLFYSYLPKHLNIKNPLEKYTSNNTSIQFEDSEMKSLRLKELEMSLAEARALSKNQFEQISKLEIDLDFALNKKDEIESHLKAQIRKNKDLIEKNQELLSKVQQKKIDEKVPEYVQGVKEKLQQDDKDFTAMSYNWAIAGIIFALLSISSAFLTFFFKLDIKDTTLTELLYYYTRGLLGVALLSWLSYFCLNNSKKYTHEAIIRKDRQHALMFGEVFLQIYGSTATKQDAIDVFKDWNMSANSAFSDKTQQPPSLFNMLGSVLDKKSAANDDKVSGKS